jgi:hypothetical protein
MRAVLVRAPVLSLVLAAALVQPATAVPIVIDSFEVGDFNVLDDTNSPGPTTAEQSGLATTDVAGGVRLVTATAAAGLVPLSTATALLVTTPLDDATAMTIVAADGSGSFEYSYDGIANGVQDGFLGALNLDLSGQSSIDITLTALNVVGNVTVTLYNANTARDQTLAIVDGVLSFPMSGFTLDPSSIKDLRVLIGPINPGEAPLVTSIVAVPEPTAGLLVAAGLVGLGLRRRRPR